MDKNYNTLNIHPERLTLSTFESININNVYIITPINECCITDYLGEKTIYTSKVILDKIVSIDGTYEILKYKDIITFEQKIYYKEIQKKINNPNKFDGIIVSKQFEFIDESLCDELIDYINNVKEFEIKKWGETNNVNCKTIQIKNIQDNGNFNNKLFNVIGKFIQYIFNKYNVISKGDSGYCLRKIYGPTRQHADGIFDYTNKDEPISLYKIRNLSVIIALNDDYEGGQFYFPSQDRVIKLKKGQLIAFPPYWTHPHTVLPPLNGTYRYTINTWLYQ
jgi:hypothetical protein